jgi:hypothetical protein
VWPCLALPAKDFSRGYFTFWVIIAMTWGLVATIAMIVWPIAENITPIMNTMKNLVTGNRVNLKELDDITAPGGVPEGRPWSWHRGHPHWHTGAGINILSYKVVLYVIPVWITSDGTSMRTSL